MARAPTIPRKAKITVIKRCIAVLVKACATNAAPGCILPYCSILPVRWHLPHLTGMPAGPASPAPADQAGRPSVDAGAGGEGAAAAAGVTRRGTARDRTAAAWRGPACRIFDVDRQISVRAKRGQTPS